MTEQVVEGSDKKQQLGKTRYFLAVILILVIICTGLIAALSFGYKKFYALQNQLGGKDQALTALKTTQQELTAKIASLSSTQKKLGEDLNYNQ
ncbi:hypothetical protein [Piscirickettsia litoralis]|uniref:hypothetical protein n=1 Tax=Piscirickettsia litoralis TaxID=1891921 RepID=UPI000AC17E50|nr:hypothetical protein [Piscirickettsia litoralis]